ncbi:ammonia-dependent NAD(+) synthetase [Comamonas faecalis]|uniref:NH(3)-dependent NAD(+) synthetase n=1 Tax=Comamonas faecalis TaxID=1387849 RepID=A0ABP7QRC7_9BURK
MHPTQQAIIDSLRVTPPFAGPADVQAQIARRVAFIQAQLRASHTRTLVLGISGGVDSSVAGRLAQLAAEGLRAETGDGRWRFIAVRLPYRAQFDEADAQAALAFIRPDEVRTVAIEGAVTALAAPLADLLQPLATPQHDSVLGNIKARVRMVAQYAIANATNGLVIGTDHAAEAVMGFFTKHGDGACDLEPLAGLVKGQVRAIGEALGAPEHLVRKVPTADLEDGRPGLPDEAAHGVRYAAIDAFLHGQSVDAGDFERIVRAFEATRHKRALPATP